MSSSLGGIYGLRQNYTPLVFPANEDEYYDVLSPLPSAPEYEESNPITWIYGLVVFFVALMLFLMVMGYIIRRTTRTVTPVVITPWSENHESTYV